MKFGVVLQLYGLAVGLTCTLLVLILAWQAFETQGKITIDFNSVGEHKAELALVIVGFIGLVHHWYTAVTKHLAFEDSDKVKVIKVGEDTPR